MWTPFHGVDEEGEAGREETADLPALASLGARPPEMPPLWYRVLGGVFEGKKPKQLAEELGYAVQTVRQILSDVTFKAWVERAEDAIFERIARGEFGAMAIAKANTTGAMQRIVGLSKEADKDAVKLSANLEILKYGGLLPAKPVEVASVERLVDLMSAEEQVLFAETGALPERLHDQVARLSASVIKAAESQRLDAEVVATFEREEPRQPNAVAREELVPAASPDDIDEEGGYVSGPAQE